MNLLVILKFIFVSKLGWFGVWGPFETDINIRLCYYLIYFVFKLGGFSMWGVHFKQTDINV